MIKEKYTQLLLSHQIRGLTTIGDTQSLATMPMLTKRKGGPNENKPLFHRIK